MNRLISAAEIGEAWNNINADWPEGRFQELRRLVKDVLHDAQLAVEAFEDAAKQRAAAAAPKPQQFADAMQALICPGSVESLDQRARKAGL